MKHDAGLLDEIIDYLRSETVPEMPAALAISRTVKARDSVWYLVPASVLAASIVGLLVWRSSPSQPLNPRAPIQFQNAHTEIRESTVLLQAVDLVKPLTELEKSLSVMDAEIAELQCEAALLDVRRTADELLTQK